MSLKHFGLIQLVPPLLDGVAETDINNINLWINIGLASVDPNLWGLRRYKGVGGIVGKAIARAVKGKGVLFHTEIDMGGIPVEPYNVAAYHEVIYGYKPWEYFEGHPHTPKILELPMKVRNIYDSVIISYTNHDIKRHNTWINLAYDIWLTRDAKDMTCSKGDVELMIWLYRSQDLNPAGEVVETIDMPIILDNKITTTSVDIYLQPTMLLPPGTVGGWTYIALKFVRPVTKGVVALNLTEIMQIVREVLAKHTPDMWSREKFDELYIRSIELGTEVFFGSTINVEWDLNEFYLAVFPVKMDIEKAFKIILDPVQIFKV
ncbi:glycoside hydrolase family 12 [Ignisphaera aggregans DSM 17230]|uniref:Glycoside hydrolase family 12 n=1 Tax=Ignisphaera aggregans (strain DSM 17230 / JCM 13409 / AQ1.S1) TaxID=583356 RepID=E0SSM3_IGNAA|nr:glycoside hydrolase family 12 [Ignisphaera aggregans DSM 17230]